MVVEWQEGYSKLDTQHELLLENQPEAQSQFVEFLENEVDKLLPKEGFGNRLHVETQGTSCPIKKLLL
jgi:hypothetical protein